jgi:hypothetical protein
MALTEASRGRWWSRLHFIIRFLGLTGLLAVGAGVALAYLNEVLSRQLLTDWSFLRSVLTGETGNLGTRIAVTLLAAGGVLALLALIVELLVIGGLVAGRRSAFGFNAAVQAALVVAMVVAINIYSYRHYFKADWTRQRQFTLPVDIQQQLGELRGETTIVVYQRHKTFGPLNDKPDAYDYAAERKVVEKVKDLVDQFREFGSQFRVVVLDVEEEGYNDKLDQLTKDDKPLREAIDSAPENSIFFHAGDKVQRLSFNEFYQLDKTASHTANGGKGNLVLLNQGVEPFARNVLNLDEKRPKVGILVIHEWLTTKGPEDFGLAGLKKTLTERGFDVQDVILKKWSEMTGPEPAVYTYDESRLEQLEEQIAELDADLKALKEDLGQFNKARKHWQSASLDELSKENADQLRRLQITRLDETMRRRVIDLQLSPQIALRELALRQTQEEHDEALKEKSTLNVDTEAEQRRMTDLKAKLARSLADCDLLFIPRMTLRNVLIGDRIPNRLYRLDEAQVAAIKDFLKSSKPVLACFGPANENPNDRMRMAQLGPDGPDELENLFGQLGIKFGKQTVLFNAESKAFAERRSGLLVAGAVAEVPPVEFEPLPPRSLATVNPPGLPKQANPIRESMQIAAHSLGRKDLDLRLRYPRPIYYQAANGNDQPFEPEFLITSAASWNEEQPFPTRERTPRFEPPKDNDPARGTIDEKRRGPFPVGLAVEARLPAVWYAEAGTKPGIVRVAAIGSGSVFTGQELSPAKEELLLNTCNWLLGRDDLLPRADRVWSYPRVTLNPREQALWHWAGWVGLPAVFAYLGLVVVLVRRLR